MSFAKSKAFKDREKNARERLREVAKQDLVADLCRLFGDTTFSDVLFIVKNVEFQAHTVVLRARAPSFCRRFLPSHTSPASVQTCVQINGLEAAEFEAFLRSCYTDDDFKDYKESSYPWRKQITADSDQQAFVTCMNKQTEVKTVSQDNISGMCTQFGSVTTGSKQDPHTQNFVEQADVTNTQLDCNLGTSVKDRIVGDVDGIKVDSSDTSSSGGDIAPSRPFHCSSSCETTINANQFDVNSGCSSLIFTSNDNNSIADPVGASSLPVDGTNHCYNGMVDHGGENNSNDLSCQLVQTFSNVDKINSACSTPLSSGNLVKKENIVQDEVNESCLQSNQGYGRLELNHSSSREIFKGVINAECCNIGRDLLQLLISDIGSDVTFVINGGNVKAHKAILCARSNYFSAMLHGNWVEGKTNEIPLIGVNYDGFMTVLKYMYGGTTNIGSDLAVMCDTLPLVDMYNLDGLKEIIVCNLRIEKCHLFHKPCGECITGISECLEVSELFNLTELKKSCLKWMAKHFDRVLATKGFTTLPKHLQEELLLEIEGGFVISSAIEVLNHCDKISSCTPPVKWTEPIHVAVSSIQESCLLFISSNFFSLIDETSFHEVLKGVGWSIPVLEKILSAVKKQLAIDNCCDQLRAILKLKRLLHLRNIEEDKESFPEEVDDLIVRLHSDCVKFIRCNLFKVTRSEGWRRLKPPTQRDIKEGAVFSGLTESGNRRGAQKDTVRRNSVPPSSRPSTTKPLQRVGLDSRTGAVGRGSSATNPPRLSKVRIGHCGTGGLAPTNKRPLSARPASSVSGKTSDLGKMSSTSSGVSQKKPLSTRITVAFGSSIKSTSFSQNPMTDRRPPSGRNSTSSGRGKTLSSSTSLNQKLSSRSSDQKDSIPSRTSSAKNSSSLQRKAPNGRPSSAASFSGTIKEQKVSTPAMSTAGSNRSFLKRSSREKRLSVEGACVKMKKDSRNVQDQSLSNARHCLGDVIELASSDSSGLLQLTDFQVSSSVEKLLQERSSTTQEVAEEDSVSKLSEISHSCEQNPNEPPAMQKECINENSNMSHSEWSSDTRANRSLTEESFAESVSKENPEENLLPLNDGTDGFSSNSNSLCTDDSPGETKFSDSLE